MSERTENRVKYIAFFLCFIYQQVSYEKCSYIFLISIKFSYTKEKNSDIRKLICQSGGKLDLKISMSL